mmetsp:Transcript_13114/g.35892  ORF Transcript_13114/g.35892 Transcript_13114/m.35892 type:complete len:451 (-) Transcript_13114:162-1514(-)
MPRSCRFTQSLAWVLLGTAAGATPEGLEAALQSIATKESAKYNCAVSIAYRDAKGRAMAAAGTVDGKSLAAGVHDGYAFGSVTKVLTGASIMRLVSEGHLKLHSKVAPLVDPLLAAMAKRDSEQGFSSLADLWGADNVTGLTIKELLSMQSGVPDFDTATPCFPGQGSCVPADALREDLYTNPSQGISPTRLLDVAWVKNRWRGPCKPYMPGMSGFCYSSTNFMLLGMVLLAHQGTDKSFKDLDQAVYLPTYVKESLKFAMAGPPLKYTPVHGFDRTSYNVPKGQHNDHDNWNVSGVFSGWTASDIVAPASGITDLIWEVYGPPSSIAPKEFIDKMLPSESAIYGLATFNLDRNTGQKGKYGKAYGHLGATYGYQSVTAYFPGLEIAITVATNIERDYQEQPADALCFAYNAAASLLLTRTITCTYSSEGYFSGGCKCDPIEVDETILVV